MDTIQNIDLVKDLLTPARLEKLEQHALAFEERSKIQFSIIGLDTDALTVAVSQGPMHHKWMVKDRELARIAKSFFEFYFPDFRVIVVFGHYIAPERALPETPKTPKLEVAEDDEGELEIFLDQKSVIHNIHLLEGLLTPAKLQRMENHAEIFQQNGKITFMVHNVTDQEVEVGAVQLPGKRTRVPGLQELFKVCKSFFEFYIESKQIVVTMPGIAHPPKSQITTTWVLEKIKERGITPEQVAAETGLRLSRLNNWMHGHTTMPDEVKAMFWYMLR